MTKARVSVTVEDREVYLALGIFHTCEDRMILAGWADDTPYMQRIARHRLAGVAAGREEAAEIAEKCVPGGYMSDRERSYCADHGEDIAAAIRQMGGE